MLNFLKNFFAVKQFANVDLESESKSTKPNPKPGEVKGKKESEKNQDSNPKPSPKKPNPKDNNTKIILNIVTLVVTFGMIGSILYLTNRIENQTENPNTFSELISEIREGNVSKITVASDKSSFEVELFKTDAKDRDEVKTETYPNISTDALNSPLDNINNSLGENSIKVGSGKGEIIYEEVPKQWYDELIESGYLWYIFLILIFIGAAVFLMRRIGDANSRAISFGNSQARVYDQTDDQKKGRITFKDVAGNEEAKQELFEIVDFLQRGEEYLKMGAKIPKGLLLVGSPGNGKTLMAKAVAGEAKVPFFYVSGSEFVEMFVGVGAGRVRSLFKRAKKKSPCVIFIDEIDAVGRQRGTGMGGGNDEREQTLNQILVEMDGFELGQSVIVIGATNRPDVLDPALLRPGRFDRQITVTPPDKRERKKILEVHVKNKKIEKDVDLGIIAQRTPGFSGADLMNVLNEAAILTVREKKPKITNQILREAIEKVAFGPSLKSKLITEKQKKLTAYHEAGHALVSTVLPKATKVQKVSIIPRGKAAGYTFHADENDKMTRSKEEFLSEIKVLFGGYVVEEMIFKDVSTGASNDLAKASQIARGMVKKFGMSDLGPVSYDEDHGMTFLGRDMVERQHYSEKIAGEIDSEVNRIMKDCYKQCKDLVKKYRTYLEEIANSLLKNEVLEFEEFNAIVKDILVKEEADVVVN